LHLAGTQASAGKQASRSSRLAFTRFTRSAIRFAQPAIGVGACLAVAGGLLALAGCGNQYRPVISAINPVGPASQPTKYAVAISNPGTGLPGLVTFVDFSGDTVIITASIGISPQYLAIGSSGGTGYTINGDGTINTFAISASLLSSAVEQTTLLAGANPNMIFPEGTYTYISQPGRSDIAELTGTPPTLQQEISAIGQNPVYIAGIAAAPRIYAISQGPLSSTGVPTGAGTAAAIETGTNTVSSTFTVGTKPVYGVMTADARRAFVINQGSNNVTVINAESNALDSGVTNGTISDSAAVGPVWADFAPPLNEMVVANEGDGTTNGSVSIFSIPLCSANAIANPNCSTTNPIDAVGFGTLVAHIPVGKNPLMIAALQDGTQAYVINQGDSTVSVINLTTNTVTATIPVPDTPNPTFIAATTGTPTGKVYVTSTSSTTMTVIRTDTNTVDTTIPLQGAGIQVRVTAN